MMMTITSLVLAPMGRSAGLSMVSYSVLLSYSMIQCLKVVIQESSGLLRRFEQECQFLSRIKHPNIVQYLGTSRDPRSRRLALLMELMDESLTRFLERSTGPLPYHIQLNICYDVALALSYLHSNAIIHRDLSSNNVLLIGDGSRAKVTDFGMSKLMDMNPSHDPTDCLPWSHCLHASRGTRLHHLATPVNWTASPMECSPSR